MGVHWLLCIDYELRRKGSDTPVEDRHGISAEIIVVVIRVKVEQTKIFMQNEKMYK
jgi:hypothetical protein